MPISGILARLDLLTANIYTPRDLYERANECRLGVAFYMGIREAIKDHVFYIILPGKEKKTLCIAFKYSNNILHSSKDIFTPCKMPT